MKTADTPEGAARAVTIRNRRGLHARAAAKLVQTVEAHPAEVTVVKDDMEVTGNSIMGLMMLAAGPGTRLELRASGEQAEAVLAALEDLIERKFDED